MKKWHSLMLVLGLVVVFASIQPFLGVTLGQQGRKRPDFVTREPAKACGAVNLRVGDLVGGIEQEGPNIWFYLGECTVEFDCTVAQLNNCTICAHAILYKWDGALFQWFLVASTPTQLYGSGNCGSVDNPVTLNPEFHNLQRGGFYKVTIEIGVPFFGNCSFNHTVSEEILIPE